ncbi:MAG: TIGR03067 domain-containing protein [Planctomycetia bacterium]|nr:TIGR03067 domain-containing protein [Planctomycetia bacterium]
MRTLATMLLAGFMSAAGGAAPDGAKEDAKHLQGTWEVQSAEYAGFAIPQEQIRGWQMVFAGDKVTVTFLTWKQETLPFSLDASQDPKEIDLTNPDKMLLPGLYALDKDTLKICLGGDKRPGTFASRPGSNCFMVLKRKPPAVKKN